MGNNADYDLFRFIARQQEIDRAEAAKKPTLPTPPQARVEQTLANEPKRWRTKVISFVPYITESTYE